MHLPCKPFSATTGAKKYFIYGIFRDAGIKNNHWDSFAVPYKMCVSSHCKTLEVPKAIKSWLQSLSAM